MMRDEAGRLLKSGQRRQKHLRFTVPYNEIQRLTVNRFATPRVNGGYDSATSRKVHYHNKRVQKTKQGYPAIA